MTDWPDRRWCDLTGATTPIVQAPMAGAGGVALAVEAMRGGAVGSLPCALLSPDAVASQVAEVRAAAFGPLNLNFFCHAMPAEVAEDRWRARLQPFYAAEDVSPDDLSPLRVPFDDAAAAVVEQVAPQVVSFHFGLPAPALLDRVRRSGARVVGNATTVAEARWLADRGADAVIAQGFEAGGHAGWFLSGYRPVGTLALVQGIVAAVDVPVIAAGGIVDARGMAAVLRLGAAAVQLGTAFLAAPESLIHPHHRALLGTPAGDETVVTNIFTGREARGLRNRLIDVLGPISTDAPLFPHAATALTPLRARAEADGRTDYTPMWAGQGAARVSAEPARLLTERLARETLMELAR